MAVSAPFDHLSRIRLFRHTPWSGRALKRNQNTNNKTMETPPKPQPMNTAVKTLLHQKGVAEELLRQGQGNLDAIQVRRKAQEKAITEIREGIDEINSALKTLGHNEEKTK